jgi:hypothetical protein
MLISALMRRSAPDGFWRPGNAPVVVLVGAAAVVGADPPNGAVSHDEYVRPATTVVEFFVKYSL